MAEGVVTQRLASEISWPREHIFEPYNVRELTRSREQRCIIILNYL